LIPAARGVGRKGPIGLVRWIVDPPVRRGKLDG
jgi:hypothetical protein